MGERREEIAIRPDAVAIYVRWSTEEQGEGTTLQEQTERCKSYLLSQGWQVNANLIFVDDGYSGATLHRPAMTRLRAMIAKGQVDCVVSLKIDRLSRSLVDCVDLVLREWAGICHYKSVSQPVNTTDELSRVFFAILAGFAEYERALIRERTFSGLVRRVKEGNFWGSGKAPYGYIRVATGKLAVNESEADVVRSVFAMAAEDGMGVGQITARLNQLAIPGPGGKGWWAFTVRNLLKNRIYIGYLEYGKRYVDQRSKADGKRVLKWREKPLVEPSSRTEELVLVSDETFDRAQQVLARKAELARKRGRRAATSHLLVGLVRCRCGGAMITGYDRLGRRYYFCQERDRTRGGKGCPINGGLLYADQIEPAVGDVVLQRITSDSDGIGRVLEQRWAREQDQGAGAALTLRKRLEELARQEQRLRVDLGRILRQARRQEITLPEMRAFEQDIEIERQEFQRQRTAVEAALAGLPNSEAELTTLLEWAEQVDPWAELPLETQKELLRCLMHNLVVYKPKGRGQAPELDLYWRA